jgi:hypothetical protein
MRRIEATIDGIVYEIEYEYDITDKSLCHLQKLIAYFEKFDASKVLVWVPGAEDDECEFGVYPCPDAEYSQSGELEKTIILTRGDEAKRAFGSEWMEEHIYHAAVSWGISEDEYAETINV